MKLCEKAQSRYVYFKLAITRQQIKIAWNDRSIWERPTWIYISDFKKYINLSVGMYSTSVGTMRRLAVQIWPDSIGGQYILYSKGLTVHWNGLCTKYR